MTWLPAYLVMQRHYSMKLMAIWGSIPFMGSAVTSLAVFGVVIALYQGPILSGIGDMFPNRALATGLGLSDNIAVSVFGGIDSYNDTWLWNGTRWSLAKPSLSPAGRFGAAAAYDPATDHIYIVERKPAQS